MKSKKYDYYTKRTKLISTTWDKIRRGYVYHWEGRRFRKIGLNEGQDVVTGARVSPQLNGIFKVRVSTES